MRHEGMYRMGFLLKWRMVVEEVRVTLLFGAALCLRRFCLHRRPISRKATTRPCIRNLARGRFCLTQ